MYTHEILNQIVITRLSVNFFDLSDQEDFPEKGIWVFIVGAENKWSLNHKKYNDENRWYSASIIPNAVVYDFIGNQTTPGDVFRKACKKLLEQRVSFVLDHEDAGFFIPESSFKNISGVEEYELHI